MRKSYVENHPEAKASEVGKGLGIMWKALDEKVKQAYKDYHGKCKVIYAKQLKEYEEKGTFTPETIALPGKDKNEEKKEKVSETENKSKESKQNENDKSIEKKEKEGKVESEESKEKKNEETKKDDTAKEESKNGETKNKETEVETKG